MKCFTSISVLIYLIFLYIYLSNNKGSFLDLVVKIENNQFSIQVYDNRDDFPFL